jgi:hypothetical protein
MPNRGWVLLTSMQTDILKNYFTYGLGCSPHRTPKGVGVGTLVGVGLRAEPFFQTYTRLMPVRGLSLQTGRIIEFSFKHDQLKLGLAVDAKSIRVLFIR